MILILFSIVKQYACRNISFLFAPFELHMNTKPELKHDCVGSVFTFWFLQKALVLFTWIKAKCVYYSLHRYIIVFSSACS